MALEDLVVSLFWKSRHSRVADVDMAISPRIDDSVVDGDGDGDGTETSTSDYGMGDLPLSVYLCEQRHKAFESTSTSTSTSSNSAYRWEVNERVKTSHVALVLCSNIGVDPPDSVKIDPCARMECWIDPFSLPPRVAMREIAQNLRVQYQNWESKAHYEVLCDPTVSHVLMRCRKLRSFAKSGRVLFHYKGHGVLKPTVDGEIWVFDEECTQYVPLKISAVDECLKTPSIYVFDCSAAGIVASALIELRESVTSSSSTDESAQDCIVLAACKAHETLPQSHEFPEDVFTSCLTTPIKMALRWLCKRSLFRDSLDHSLIDAIPGSQNDRRTVLGELNSILTAVTDTIAWNVLPRDLFKRLFRQDLLVASLFRNFLLAERILRSMGCSPVSYPMLPPTYQHHMWDAWDMAAEHYLSQLPSMVWDPNALHQSSSFFADQLRAFEVWLDGESEHKQKSKTLPVVLQALLGQRYRLQALVLLGRFLDKGPGAVEQALSVGVFLYVLKLLQLRSMETNEILVFICTKILAFDKSLQSDLVKIGGHNFFIKFVNDKEARVENRAMAAFVLASIMDGHRHGQEVCLEAGLLHLCLKSLAIVTSSDGQSDSQFCKWLCLCLGKLWEDFTVAQIIALRENALAVLTPLLSAPQPEIRAASIFAMGTLLDVGGNDCKGSVGEYDDDEKNRGESDVVSSILGNVSDGSPLVRAEVAVILSRIVFMHRDDLKSMAASHWKSQFNPSFSALSSGYTIQNQAYSLRRVGSYEPLVIRCGRAVSSCPLIMHGIMQGSSLSDCSSLNSDSGILEDDFNNDVGHRTRTKSLLTELYSKILMAIDTSSCDPFPYIASLGQRALSIIGVEQVEPKPLNSIYSSCRIGKPTAFYQSPAISKLGSSNSGPDMNAYAASLPLTIKSHPLSQFHLSNSSGMHRVRSLELRSHLMHSPDLGLANLLLGPGGLYERSFLPHSTIYDWSCGHFSEPVPIVVDDNKQIFVPGEDRKTHALELIAMCRCSSGKFNSSVTRWDTKFKTGTKAVLLHPFSPVVIAANENENIRIWNYEELNQLNRFDNQNFACQGISKLFLVNEFDSNLLLVASCDGNIRIWKDYSSMGKQKLVTAFSSIQGNNYGQNAKNVVLDWQQQSGLLYASGDMSSILLWDLDREQLVNCIPSTNCSVSVLSASYVHSGQFAAGFLDGSVKLYDIRTPETLVCALQSHANEERVTGIGFEPGLGHIRIVSASQAGEIQFFDMRNHRDTYRRIVACQGSLTTLIAHRHAPIIASGSAEQTIQMFDFNGKELSTIESHKSQRQHKISPVSCLTFHPYQLLLAAGAMDSMVTIHAADN